MLRRYTIGHPCCPQHHPWVGAAHDRAHGRESRDPPVVQRRGAAHHDRFELRAAPRQPPHEAPQLGLALGGLRTTSPPPPPPPGRAAAPPRAPARNTPAPRAHGLPALPSRPS